MLLNQSESQYLKYNSTNLLQSYASKEEINLWMNKFSGTKLISEMENAIKNKDEKKIKELFFNS